MDTIVKGSIETIACELTDRLQNVDTVASADFRVLDEEENEIQTWTPAENIEGMRVDCLINTETWAEGTYKLYVRPSVPPESPILGPFRFGVS